MPSSDLPLRRRVAVRALLLDDQERILLLKGRDPALPEGPTWWFTPGGGVGPGESPVTAVLRECWEELGRAPEQVHGPIAHRRYEFPFDGHWLVQDTDYYWARVTAFDPAPRRLSELEQRFILGWRWWPRQELADTPETIYPEDLQALLALATA